MLPETLEFQTVYEAFQPRIRRYLAARVGEDAAEDVAQDVFVRIYAALSGFRGESQISTWVYRIASNAAVDRLRASMHRRTSRDTVSVDQISESEDERLWADTDAPSADEQAIRQEMSECVQALVGRLPETYRTALLASEEGGESSIRQVGGGAPPARSARRIGIELSAEQGLAALLVFLVPDLAAREAASEDLEGLVIL